VLLTRLFSTWKFNAAMGMVARSSHSSSQYVYQSEQLIVEVQRKDEAIAMLIAENEHIKHIHSTTLQKLLGGDD
jgi:hypothetical protein